jgi:hypothetical protein
MVETFTESDPSHLTTQALLREIANLRELLMSRIVALEDAVKLAHEDLVRVPTETDKAINHVRGVLLGKLDVVDERFHRIATQFLERDTRVDQSARTSKEALDAALQAAKELVGMQNQSFMISIAKSEAATEKQIDLLVRNMSVGTKANDDKIDDLKQRLTLLEGQDRGKSTAVVAQHANTASAASVIGVVLGVIGTLALLATFLINALGSHQ